MANINKFKRGDLITRSESAKGDRSYMADELEFEGVANGIIFLIRKDFGDEFSVLKLRTDWWSEGWDYFPRTLYQMALHRAKQKAKEVIARLEK